MTRAWLLCAALLAGACTQDDPLELGEQLLPPNAIRTFEVIIEPERFFVFDTAFGLYSSPADVGFIMLARAFEGTLNSRALVRYTLPRTIQVRDAAGTLRTDSFPTYFAGDLVMLVDTARSTSAPVELQLFRTTEGWDRGSATWQFRVDTAGARLPWAQPGGSPGVLAGTGSFVAGNDTVRIPVDSATLAVWADTTNEGRGGLIVTPTLGTRLRTTLPVLHVQARSSFRADTAFDLQLVPSRTFIFEPEQPDSVAVPRVGGTPEWRTLLRLRQRLDTLTIVCPGGASICVTTLGDVTINYAALRLQPVPSPAGFAPEGPLTVTAHVLIPSELVPLQRSPLTPAVGITDSISVSAFATPGAPIVELPITELVRLLAADTAGTSLTFVPSHLALAPTGVFRTFGFGTFTERPRLRLVVTLARELQEP